MKNKAREIAILSFLHLFSPVLYLLALGYLDSQW